MKLQDLLKGKLVNVMTDAKIVVQLEIETIEEKIHTKDLAPATKENDWWPPSIDYTKIDITFTNGLQKTYNTLSEIDIIL